jgi:hypothetical protein
MWYCITSNAIPSDHFSVYGADASVRLFEHYIFLENHRVTAFARKIIAYTRFNAFI